MLNYIRARKSGLISWLLIGGIILTFTLWGYFSKESKSDAIAARVNREIIPMSTFVNQYQEFYRAYQDLLKDNFSEEMARMYNIKKIALDRLINTKILIQAAKKIGIIVTDQDVANMIMTNPVFKNSDGKFDKDLYQRILKANRYTEKKFENVIRDELYTQKIKNIINIGIKISPYELLKQYTAENDSVSLSFLKLSPSDLNFEITPIELSAFIKEKHNEISKYYNEKESEFKKPEQIKASHILIKASDDSDESYSLAKEKIDSIHKIVTPQNFKELAKKYSQGPSTEINGDLGIFDRQAMTKEFSDIAFSQQVQTISNPVKTKFGWHLIYVENKFPSSEKPLTEVEREIAQKLLRIEKEKTIASNKAKDLVNSFENESELKKIMSSLNIKWERTKPFKYGTYISEIGRSEEVIDSAFKLKQKGEFIPRFFLINDDYYFFKLANRETIDIKAFNEKLESMTLDLRQKKETILFNDWQSDLIKTAKIVINPQITTYDDQAL